MKKPVVYVLRGSSGRLYIGSTMDFERRLRQHRSGQAHTTHRLGYPLEVIAVRGCEDLPEARALEHRLKRWKNPGKVLDYLQKP